jgi:hypothetical protein
MEVFMKCKSAIFICLLLHFSIHNGYGQTNDSLNGDGLEMQEFGRLDSLANFKDYNENDTILKWKRSRDFAYIHYLDSLLRKQKDIKSDTVRFDETSGRIIRNQNSGADVSAFGKILNSLPFRIFFWILAVIFIAFISYKVLFNNGIFGRKRNKLALEIEEQSLEELRDVSEYDSLIGDAEARHDFNDAVRFLFLKTLKNLSDEGLISFTAEKTNQEYLKEMINAPNARAFEALIRGYEFAWYGKHLVSENQYLQLKEAFISFNKKTGSWS